ncbi:MAG: alpha/beta hydrolase [Planctomycetota bacterium]|jgi:acetyl esterase/lipase|nr:alpha/beta hydrolase [Planctomycetota bacterium]MDP7251953.1 alpha/beta hydrolase [Planctomycetota bacterium]
MKSHFSVIIFAACFGTLGAEQSKLDQWLERYPEADTNKDGKLTWEEARAFRDKRKKQQQKNAKLPRAKRIAADLANVKYGPHARNVIDLWKAESDEPTPLAVYIHGGGFKGGDKRSISPATVKYLLDQGISVAAIHYRLTENGKHPFPIPMQDGARAIQFMRYKAKEWNLNKRIACFGGSAGACMSMWLAFHDDLADPENEDPVLRESTRITCAGPNAGQSSLHSPTLHEWFGVKSLVEHPALRPLFGVGPDEDPHAPKFLKLMKEASPITYLTEDDPPVFMTYRLGNVPIDEKSNPNLWVHHPMLGIKLKEAMDRLGLECIVQYKGNSQESGYANQSDFMVKKLKSNK